MVAESGNRSGLVGEVLFVFTLIEFDEWGRAVPITPFLGDQQLDPETKRVTDVAFEMAARLWSATGAITPTGSLLDASSRLRRVMSAIPTSFAGKR